MEQQIKDTPKNKSNISKTSKSIFHFYPDRCIALGDYLDILLNRVNASGRRNLPAFEDINYSLEPKSKLVPLSSYTPNVSANKRTSTNQMKDGNSKQPENEEKFLFEGGILLPRPLESEREGKEAGDEGSSQTPVPPPNAHRRWLPPRPGHEAAAPGPSGEHAAPLLPPPVPGGGVGSAGYRERQVA